MKGIRVQTDRLLLREVVPEDLEAIHAYAGDPEVLRYLPLEPSTREQTAASLRTMLHAQHERPRRRVVLAVVPDRAAQAAGTVVLRISSQQQREGHLAVCLRRSSWGHGYATEACSALLRLGFGSLELHRIHTTVSVDNLASVRLMHKLGMRNEGRLVEHLQIAGEWLDSFVFALLRREWQARDPSIAA
jgi:ribosomal-protein-alanine N-acetyltransferase